MVPLAFPFPASRRLRPARTFLLLAGLSLVTPLFAQETAEDADLAQDRARGWAPPTPEDVELYRSLAHRLEALHLNSLALRRLHEADLADELDQHALLVRRPGRGSITRPINAARNLADAHALEPALGVRRLPREVDNSTLPCFPPLFDQGRLEACTAVVSTYYQLTHTVGLMRGWNQARLSNENRFSPAWTYNLTNNGANSGVSLIRAYSALAAHGAVSLKDFPYRGSPSPAANYRRWSEDPALWQAALANRIERFGLVDAREPALFLREIKRLLLNGHLLTASTAIDGWNRRSIATPPDETARHAGDYICTEVSADSPVNHAVTLVGYDDDIWIDLDGNGQVDPGEKGAFKIANSWGRADWNRGFRWLHYTAVARLRGVPRSDNWSAAFWLDRVFWLIPYRYYQPARILELDVDPALRKDIRLVAGAAPADDAKAYSDRIETPNVAFSQMGGPFGFDGAPRPDPRLMRISLDFTPPLMAPDLERPALFLQLRHPSGAHALQNAFLLDPLTGSRERLRLGAPDSTGTRWAQAPRPPSPDTPPPLVHGLPVSIALVPGQPVSLPFSVESSGGENRPVRVAAFSSRAAVITEQEIFVSPEENGRYRLDLYPRPNARGSALVLVHATDGWTRSTTPLRINFETETNTAPRVEISSVRRDGDAHVISLRVTDAQTPSEKLTVFFDTPQVDAVEDFTLGGQGQDRELRIRLKRAARADLSISAFDGELIGESCVSLRGANSLISAAPLSSPIAARGE